MLDPRHLDNAPITEAIVDFRVKARQDFDLKSFNDLRPELIAEFPKVSERRGFEAKFDMQDTGPGVPTARDLGVDGLLFHSQDGLEIAQFRVDGFTFNRLPPYTSWDQILPRAWRLWERYVAVALPEQVTRLALRYINRLEIPAPVDRLGDFLTAVPPVPPGLSYMPRAFLSRVVLEDPISGLRATLGQAVEPQVTFAYSPVILDIDAYRVRDFDPSDPAVRESLDLLHAFKNRVFFGSITKLTLELFNAG